MLAAYEVGGKLELDCGDALRVKPVAGVILRALLRQQTVELRDRTFDCEARDLEERALADAVDRKHRVHRIRELIDDATRLSVLAFPLHQLGEAASNVGTGP